MCAPRVAKVNAGAGYKQQSVNLCDHGKATAPEKDTVPEQESTRNRASTLLAAILHFGDCLDPDTVLREIVPGARELTCAQLGMADTVDAGGTPTDYIFSGFTPEAEENVLAWS